MFHALKEKIKGKASVLYASVRDLQTGRTSAYFKWKDGQKAVKRVILS